MRKNLPDTFIKVKENFGFDINMKVPAYRNKDIYVPEIDQNYFFDTKTTISILAGFTYNKRVMITGYHGTGKSTHIEQVAARLNWPCIRINLDSHISRIDLLGRDTIVIENGLQITKFREGILPWACQKNMALVFDEYDAGRPDVMFVIQRILETSSQLTLLDQSSIIIPHPSFRLFATANTVGLGDKTGLYHGTQQINQSQMDRWSIVTRLNYLSEEKEINIILSKVQILKTKKEKEIVLCMVSLANMIRKAFSNGDLSTIMSLRTIINWAENYVIFRNVQFSFQLTFLNKCDDEEKEIISEFYQRVFNEELTKE